MRINWYLVRTYVWYLHQYVHLYAHCTCCADCIYLPLISQLDFDRIRYISYIRRWTFFILLLQVEYVTAFSSCDGPVITDLNWMPLPLAITATLTISQGIYRQEMMRPYLSPLKENRRYVYEQTASVLCYVPARGKLKIKIGLRIIRCGSKKYSRYRRLRRQGGNTQIK